MSKGSNRRPGKGFSSNYDKIDWSKKEEQKLVKIKTDTGWKYVSPESLKPKKRSHYIMPDIEPYKAVAGDMAGQYITSRSQHREFLRRNNFTEVGNEKEYFFKYDGKSHDNPTREG